MPAPKKVYTEVLGKVPRNIYTSDTPLVPNKIRKAPTNDYLKYYRPLRRYYQMKYKLPSAEFDMIFFLYSEKYFTTDDFDDFNNILPWNTKRFQYLVKEGWIVGFSMNRSDHKKVYELSYKGKHLCNAFYDVLNGKEVPMGRALNPLMGADGKKKGGLRFSQKVLRLFIVDINKIYKKARKTGIDDFPYD